jgi:hypothetical protein
MAMATRCGEMTVVEFVGVAGSGKTFAAERLVRDLRARNRPAHPAMAGIGPGAGTTTRWCRKSALALGELARDPRAMASLVRAIHRSRQGRRRDAVAMILTWGSMRALVRRARRADRLAVFDQGFLMALWSTGLRGDPGPCRDLLRSHQWQWVLPDAVVRVRTDHDLALAQVRARGPRQSRVETLDDGSLLVALQDFDNELSTVTGWWEAQTAGPVLALANGGGGAVQHELDRVATLLCDIRTHNESSATFKGERP